MDEKFLEQLKQAASQVRLPEERKIAMRVSLAETMQKPVRHPWWFWFVHPAPIFGGLAVAVITTGAVSFAAEKAVPGDTLYPFKIGTEEVRGMIAISPQAAADWEVERALRRIDEEHVVQASGGDSDSPSAQYLDDKFSQHIDNVQRDIRMLASRGNLNDAATLTKRLEDGIAKRLPAETEGEDDDAGTATSSESKAHQTSTPDAGSTAPASAPSIMAAPLKSQIQPFASSVPSVRAVPPVASEGIRLPGGKVIERGSRLDKKARAVFDEARKMRADLEARISGKNGRNPDED